LLRENAAHIAALANLLAALPRGLIHLVAILYPRRQMLNLMTEGLENLPDFGWLHLPILFPV
jgi:hypothetical protein